MRETSPDAPIGVFDSGIGGLTVLKALGTELPDEHFIYLGDTARLPYGTKSPETVARYSLQAVAALLRYDVKCLVVACNTASSLGLRGVRQLADSLPVVGVIEPGAEAACVASASGHIAVIATEGTVRGGAYQEAIVRLRPDARVTARPAQLFVALAEEGLCEGPIAEAVARHYLEPLLGAANGNAAGGLPGSGLPAISSSALASSTRAPSAPDTLVLGCTHFPMLADTIRRVVGPKLRIVDSAATTAQAVHATLHAAKLVRAPGSPAVIRFLATDSVDRFARIGGRFLDRPIAPSEVELVDL